MLFRREKTLYFEYSKLVERMLRICVALYDISFDF